MSKTEANQLKKIEIWWLLHNIKEKDGYKRTTIAWGENGSRGSINVEVSICSPEKFVRFTYSQLDPVTDDKRYFDYEVPIIETQCNYGGTRYWFQCPLSKSGSLCGRRVGVLYKDGEWFGCRHCHDLTYTSRNINKNNKCYSLLNTLELERKIEKLKAKTKRKTWQGQPTRKQQKLNKLLTQSLYNYRNLQEIQKDLLNH